MLLISISLSAELLQIIREGAVLVNRGRRDGEWLYQLLLILSPTAITNCISRPSMRSEPKNLSHIQQGWSHRAHSEVKGIAGRILEAQSNSQWILILVHRMLGQKDGIIYPSLPPVISIPLKESISPV
ncbi:hypothetical protein L3X38_033010 [Prunus dulcis]|uniref:Uncharacterized protein n=1 Tax=Prunus dulcis TaxID=3755 RepID=A0AAD4VGU3_PRUDU|nr:hypothetical protein L3X38_033010 [Prunus dulcis]